MQMKSMVHRSNDVVGDYRKEMYAMQRSCPQ